MCVLCFSVVLGFVSLLASEAFGGVFRLCLWLCFGGFGVVGCRGCLVLSLCYSLVVFGLFWVVWGK